MPTPLQEHTIEPAQEGMGAVMQDEFRHAKSPTASTALNLAIGVYRQSQRQPQALAVWASGQSLTYAQLARQAAGLAICLKGSAGWPRTCSDAPPRVGILASRSAEATLAVLGANWAGSTYVPLGLKLPEERLLTLLKLCRLSALVVDEQGAQLLTPQVMQAAPLPIYALGAQAPRLPQLPDAAAAPRVTWLGPAVLAAALAREQHEQLPAPQAMRTDDPAYVIFTSGTTGVPKGVVVPVGAARHYVQTMRQVLALRPSDRLIETFELSFDVSVHNMFCAWEAGASLHILPATRVMSAVHFAREQAITVWNSVPSLVALLSQLKALSPGVLPRLRISSFGGEPLSSGIVRIWQAAAPHSRIINFYGPTEATVGCAMQEVDVQALPLYPGRDVVAIGQALPGNELAVFDAEGQRLPDGQAGELAIAGSQLAQGYLDAPAQTAARFVHRQGQRWYLTGDLAVRDESGRFHCLGRLDNQVKVMGHRVELEEVDAHVRQLLDNPLVATVAWPLVDGAAQGLVTFVGTPTLDEAASLRALKAVLPPYMLPTRLLAVADMPMSANGKIDRQALRQHLQAGTR